MVGVAGGENNKTLNKLFHAANSTFPPEGNDPMKATNHRFDYFLAGVLLFLPSSILHSARAADVEQWDVWELSLDGPRGGNPYLDVQVSATFHQDETPIVVPGFYDGNGVYTVRFSPPAQGEWQYETRSNRPELSGKSGSFTAGSPMAENHGPVQVFKTFYLRYADRTPYHQFGTTCYAWIHQTEQLQQQTLKTLAASPFNKIRFCIFPKSYVYNQNEPELFAFRKEADGTFDFDRPDPAFWHHLEQRILDLQRLGIQADLILWHPYDRWGFKKMSDAQDDQYLRYCIARLSAYRNVWWSLANEYDFMSNVEGRNKGIKTIDDWDRFFRILQDGDPHQRLRGIHNGAIWYDHTKPWVTHASLQTSDMAGGVRYREKYQKPVIYDECKYEGNIPQGWGNLDAQTMTQRFWLGTIGGCYVGHGETYLHPEDILWWSKGGALRGESPKRIQWLKDFMAATPPFDELQPLGDDQGRYLLAKPGEYYLLYCIGPVAQTIQLAGERPYKVDLIDPWEMTVLPLGTAQSGEYAVQPAKADLAYRFVPYAPGEKLRPQVKISTSAVDGVPPLIVTFRTETEGTTAWDFGDGTKATTNPASHTFTQPGLYTVTLRLTDSSGGVAANVVQIAVDRNSSEPIVRAGFADGDAPAITVKGTARRNKDGGIELPDGQPWGWASVGEGVIEDLCGLRSFTITGWLKPYSLQIGSGGNRIVFCLKRDTSGIDLVCHGDGRLRLAVNQWPDRVQNDSSAGKLVVGKWTRFAVTYDSTKTADNVCWYFSRPQDEPGEASLALDHKTTYNVGPMAGDIGPLTIGNFNATMHSYGLDRQFRGQIRRLEIYGSRINGCGALTLGQIDGNDEL
jgi:PKD repeat protein